MKVLTDIFILILKFLKAITNYGEFDGYILYYIILYYIGKGIDVK